jgi:hypothetical protein
MGAFSSFFVEREKAQEEERPAPLGQHKFLFAIFST